MQDQVQQLQTQLNTLKVRIFDLSEDRTQEQSFYNEFFGKVAKLLDITGEAASNPETYLTAIASLVEATKATPVQGELVAKAE